MDTNVKAEGVAASTATYQDNIIPITTSRTIGSTIKTTTTGVGDHLRTAVESFRRWVELKTDLQKQRAKALSVQAGASILFGLFALVWAEVALYLALASRLAPHWAALITLGVNLAIVGIANLVVASWKKKVRSTSAEANRKMTEAKLELLSARHEIRDNTSNLLETNVMARFERYKKPIAYAGTFAAGLVIARALFPKGDEAVVVTEDLESLI